MRSREISQLEAALTVLLVHLLFQILIQVENYLIYIQPITPGNGIENFLTHLGQMQIDTIVFSLFIASLVYIFTHHVFAKIFYFLILILVNMYLVLDQVAFKIFFDHLHFGLLEGTSGLNVLISSTVEEIDSAFYINVCCWLLSSILLFIVIMRCNSQDIQINPFFVSARYWLTSSILSFGFLVYSVDSTGKAENQHPVTSLFRYEQGSDKAFVEAAQQSMLGKDFYQSQFGDFQEDAIVAQEISNLEDRIKRLSSRPNIVLIVLESVGSQQLLTNGGLPSKELTPVIHELSNNAIIFDSVYSVYPATVLSHVSMSTGGPAITLGNVYADLNYYYSGPTLNKGLVALGYETAIFSSQNLDYGNMSSFYKNLNYSKYFDFGEQSKEYRKANALHSWGGDEFAVMDDSIKWIGEKLKAKKPFFLHYLSNATHHPYSVPKDFSAVVKGDSKYDKYRNAMAYTDEVIGKLINYLKAKEVLDNTIIVLVGDHGEAFGKKHAKNITHKNYLYEENVKNFMLISNASLMLKPIVSHRIAAIGDVMPTLLAFANAPEIFLPSQNLISKNFQPRMAYFHKNSPPILWGLRDGKWKYIDTRLGSKPQLYDLENDPNEIMNIAHLHEDKIDVYRQHVASWYLDSNNTFLSKLREYKPVGGKLLSKADVQNPGPKGISFGYREGNAFINAEQLKSTHEILAWVKWISYPSKKSLTYLWASPSGESYEKRVEVAPGWPDTTISLDVQPPLEKGVWSMKIVDQEVELINGNFTIQ